MHVGSTTTEIQKGNQEGRGNRQTWIRDYQNLFRHATIHESRNQRNNRRRSTPLHEISLGSKAFRFLQRKRQWRGRVAIPRRSRSHNLGERSRGEIDRCYRQARKAWVERVTCTGIVSKSQAHWHYFFDLDDIEFKDVYYTVKALANVAEVSFLIRESSPKCFHIVGLSPMSYNEVLRLQRWTPIDREQGYLLLSDVLETGNIGAGNTLRVSAKGRQKPKPRNRHTLWHPKSRVCMDYLDFFNLPIPPQSIKIVHACRPTYCFYHIGEFE